MKRLSLPALLATLALGACDAPAPTQPLADDLPVVMAPTDNNGNGVTFTLIPGPATLVTLSDDDGNVCDIGFSEQEGGKTRNDFFRENKNGSLTIHTQDKAAPLRILFEGVEYSGTGHAVATGTSTEDLTLWRNLTVSARGTVEGPGGDSFRASCSTHLRNSLDFSQADILVK